VQENNQRNFITGN